MKSFKKKGFSTPTYHRFKESFIAHVEALISLSGVVEVVLVAVLEVDCALEAAQGLPAAGVVHVVGVPGLVGAVALALRLVVRGIVLAVPQSEQSAKTV